MATIASAPAVHGFVAPGFEPVRAAFEENFTQRHELGGGCCVYLRGEKVVDLWGGLRNRHTREPWEENTLVVVHSATKGLAAMTLAIAHSRGWLDYEARVAQYWPEFAQNGKARITVRQLLAHQAGLFAFDEPVDRATLTDLDALATVLARQKPRWPPGERQAYHALTLGFHENELLRRVDPQRRSIGRFVQEEIAAPLGEELYLRVPASLPNSRLATLDPADMRQMFTGFPFRLFVEAINPWSNICRALVVNPGSSVYMDERTIYTRELEVPSGLGVTTARGLAHAYGVFAAGGEALGLRRETLDLLAAPAVPPARGFFDECMKMDGVQFSLGFMRSTPAIPFGGPRSYGAPGAGGAMGFADPDAGIGYGYVTSRMRTKLSGDPRDVALREAIYWALGRR